MLCSGTCNPFIHLYTFFFWLFCVTCFLFIHLYNWSVAVRFGLVGPERDFCSGDNPLAANGGSFAVNHVGFQATVDTFLVFSICCLFCSYLKWKFDLEIWHTAHFYKLITSFFIRIECLFNMGGVFVAVWKRGGSAVWGRVQPFCSFREILRTCRRCCQVLRLAGLTLMNEWRQFCFPGLAWNHWLWVLKRWESLRRSRQVFTKW